MTARPILPGRCYRVTHRGQSIHVLAINGAAAIRSALALVEVL